MIVSIHAPVWGATQPLCNQIYMSSVSIHAPVWGATEISNLNEDGEIRFNPRSRMGSDFCPVICAPGVSGFNPRSRMGSDSVRQP